MKNENGIIEQDDQRRLQQVEGESWISWWMVSLDNGHMNMPRKAENQEDEEEDTHPKKHIGNLQNELNALQLTTDSPAVHLIWRWMNPTIQATFLTLSTAHFFLFNIGASPVAFSINSTKIQTTIKSVHWKN